MLPAVWEAELPKRKTRSAPESESARPLAPSGRAPSRAGARAGSPGWSAWLTPSRLIAAFIALYALVYGLFVWIKFHYYLYDDFDTAIFVQATDQILHGSLFSSIRGMNWLGDHVSLVLFVIAPLYAVLRHPLTLLFLQTAVLALGAWPVASLARRELKHEGLAAVCVALYLVYPALGYTNLFEFHPEVLATTTLLATIACMAANRLGWTLLFATLSLLCKEDVALPVMMLGLTALLPGRPRRYAAALCGLAVVSLVISFAVIKPAFGSNAAEYGRMYSEWGGSPGQVVLHLLRDPLRAVATFFDTPGDVGDSILKRLYWPTMLGPFLFLPLLAPTTLIVALPVLAEHFLSNRPQQHGLIYQYTALVTPVFAAAMVRGLATLARLVARRPSEPDPIRVSAPARRVVIAAGGAAIVASLICNLLYGALLQRGWVDGPRTPEHNLPLLQDRTLRPHRDRMIAHVPREGGVVAGFEFLARLASRPRIHSLHHLFTGFYTYSSLAYPIPTDVVAFIGDIGDPRIATYLRPGTPPRLRRLMALNHLHPVDAAGDLVLFERDPADSVDLIRSGVPPPRLGRRVTYDQQLVFCGHAIPDTVVSAGGLLPIETYWRQIAPADRQFMMQIVVRDVTGQPVFTLFRHLGYLFYPTAEWPRDSLVRERYRLPVPADLAAGDYSLALRVGWWRDAPRAALSQPDDSTVFRNRLLIDLGGFTVEPRR